MIEQILFGVAGGISALWFAFHLVQGGKEVVRPFRTTPGIDPVVRDTQHLCWHYVSATLAMMAALFLLSAGAFGEDFAVAGAGLAWAFTIVGIAQVPAMGASYRDLPQGWLFLPVAALGTAGLLV